MNDELIKSIKEEAREDLDESDLVSVWEKFQQFEVCSFDEEEYQSMSQFITDWQERMCTALAVGCQYSDSVLAFKLLEKANLTFNEILDILNSLNYANQEKNLLSQTIARLKHLKDVKPFEKFGRGRGRGGKRVGKPGRSGKTKGKAVGKNKSATNETDPLGDDADGPQDTKPPIGIGGPGDKTTPRAEGTADSLLNDDDDDNAGDGDHDASDFLADDDAMLETVTTEEFVVLTEVDGEKNTAYTVGDPTRKEVVMDNEDGSTTNVVVINPDGDEDDVKENQCPVCLKFLSRKYDVKAHMATHSKVKEVYCEDCGAMFNSRISLRKHRRNNGCEANMRKISENNDPKRKFSCDFCPRRFLRKGELKVHRREHTGERPYKCDYCPELFATNRDLFKHRKTHPESVYFTCRDCNRDYSTYDKYKHHRQIRHGEEQVDVDGNFQCPMCPLLFSNSADYDSHMRDHGEGSSYQCDVCGKSFPVKQRLKVHALIHTNEKPFKCFICNKTFCQSSGLKVHFRTHSGEKPYGCDICGRTFAIKKTLIVHSRVHTKEKPYACEDCGKAFSHANVLKNHRRVHTGEKPYPCPICSKAFSRQHHVKEHLKSHKEKRELAL